MGFIGLCLGCPLRRCAIGFLCRICRAKLWVCWLRFRLKGLDVYLAIREDLHVRLEQQGRLMVLSALRIFVLPHRNHVLFSCIFHYIISQFIILILQKLCSLLFPCRKPLKRDSS